MRRARQRAEKMCRTVSAVTKESVWTRQAGFLAVAVWALTLAGAGVVLGGDASAPDFTLPNLDGQEVSLSGLLARGPVILDFWATWCKPCTKGFPGLQDLLDKYREQGLQVVAVSLDSPRSRDRVGPFVRSKKYGFEVLLDTQGRVARKYNILSIPRSLLIGPDGKIAYATVGYRPTNHTELEKALIPLLSQNAAQEGETTE